MARSLIVLVVSGVQVFWADSWRQFRSFYVFISLIFWVFLLQGIIQGQIIDAFAELRNQVPTPNLAFQPTSEPSTSVSRPCAPRSDALPVLETAGLRDGRRLGAEVLRVERRPICLQQLPRGVGEAKGRQVRV
eukprot:2314381-Rhodomonas_salina.2